MKTSIIFLLITLIHGSLLQQSSNPDELLNWCLDSKNHKNKPGIESTLYQQCLPWKDRACCTHKTTRDVHTNKMYNFDYHHCKHATNRPLSSSCREHFIQDLCFYECSPNIGPWVVKDDRKMRKERFLGVPLCASDCNSWWKACEDDFTCTNNWSQNFNWINHTNVCPQGSKCLPFKSIFRTAKYFCENVWDHSWKVVPDDEPCMRIWFDGKGGNPNDAVAKVKVNQLIGASASLTSVRFFMLLIIFFHTTLEFLM